MACNIQGVNEHVLQTYGVKFVDQSLIIKKSVLKLQYIFL